MNTKHLEYITTIAHEGSLSAAGRKLNVSQPTLSAYLADLERRLGTDLFLREKKRLIPTRAGRIYLDAATQILAVRDRTYQTIYRLSHEPTETIVIGATPLRGSIMVAKIFPQFSRRFPNVRIQIREAYMEELRSLVKTGQVNLSLGSCYDSQSSDFDHIIISREELVLGVPAFHRLAPLASGSLDRLTAIDIRELFDSPFVLLAPGNTGRIISDNIFSTAGFTPTVVFETSNNLVVSNMIREGTGVGFLPRSAMVSDAKDIVYFSLTPRYYIQLSISAAKNRVLTEAERYFVYLVITEDQNNPQYIPACNAYARSILEEFQETSL